MKFINSFFCLLFALLIVSCTSDEDHGPNAFKVLRKDATGLDFENVLNQSSEFNVFNYMYFYNGGGVAAGDFNQDGKIDLYFIGNMGPNKLFLNEGGLRFRDVTEEAGVAGSSGWSTGVSVVDINNDGMLDLYVGQLGEYQNIRGQNQLFICKGIENGIPVYADEAIYYGLDLTGFSTQAAFFDYDLDGDLDLFQLNHSLHQNGTFGNRSLFDGKKHPLAGDRLFRNDSEIHDGSKTVFTEVTEEAGIISTALGYGLGVSIGDINNDGFPDIYVGNDFHENDYLYINQQDGTFEEQAAKQMQHTSRFSMGVEIADINNDGLNDVFSLDMLPEDPFMLKRSLGEDSYTIFVYKNSLGYSNQFARNNLQLNNGNGTFSEIGLFAGVAASDWSWSPLFFDFDLDGYKDLFVSNGIPRRMNDIDYVHFQENRELKLKDNSNNVEEDEFSVIEKMPRVKLPNKFYHNAQALRFDDWSDKVSEELPSFSNGAIYADFDNDGDLDVVVNNLEDEPFIYQNMLREQDQAKGAALMLELQGPAPNRNAIGSQLVVFRKDQSKQLESYYPIHGFLSSAQIPMYVGLGDPDQIDSMVLIWPDRSCQTLDIQDFSKTHSIKYRSGLPVFDFKSLANPPRSPFAFADWSKVSGLDFKHEENPFIEFNRERLIPFMVSREGPALAVGDVNGDGLDDVFVGSAKRVPAALFFQDSKGHFKKQDQPAIRQDSIFEEVDACFADLDQDGDLDLILADGGNEYRGTDTPMRQRAFLNDGKGNFSRSNLFSELYMTASCVLPSDFNGDGLVDFFFGARAIPWSYGVVPRSALLLNKGNGQFEDITESLAPDLQEAGFIKDANWADIDADGDPDLLLAMEWAAPTIFINEKGRFERFEISPMKGWWNCMVPGDFDGDGDLDILTGNVGQNSRLQPTESEPVRMYVADFDGNKQPEQIISYYVKGREIPFANYEEMTKQLPPLKKQFLFAKDFSDATLEGLFGSKKLQEATRFEATHFESVYFENTGSGKEFVAHVLPASVQFSALQCASAMDLDSDGSLEIILGGNFFDSNIEMGYYDASYGQVLKINPDQSMQVFSLGSVLLTGQVKKIEPIQIGNKTGILIARNNESLRLLGLE
jgi:hypothetical protein